MMLRIDHRESHDIDIFLPDPQLLAFLDPQKRDFQFETQPDDYRSDGALSLKFAFSNVGQIDFIVAGALTPAPATEFNVDGQTVLLETVPEIIAKKIYYRGSNMQPRDIFDIAAAGEERPESLIEILKMYQDRVAQALVAINKLNSDFINRAIQELAIKGGYKDVAKTALERAKEILRAV